MLYELCLVNMSLLKTIASSLQHIRKIIIYHGQNEIDQCLPSSRIIILWMIKMIDCIRQQHPRSLNPHDRSNSAPNVCINMVQPRPLTFAEHQRKYNNQVRFDCKDVWLLMPLKCHFDDSYCSSFREMKLLLCRYLYMS